MTVSEKAMHYILFIPINQCTFSFKYYKIANPESGGTFISAHQFGSVHGHEIDNMKELGRKHNTKLHTNTAEGLATNESDSFWSSPDPH